MSKNSKTLFILDPGHGVDIPGKRSPEIPPGIEEWKYTREIANGIIDLNNYRDYSPIEITTTLDSEEDKNMSISLSRRVKFSNEIYEKQKNIRDIYFVSLHTNAAGNDGWYGASGCTCFVSKRCSNRSQYIADKIVENISDILEIPNRGTKKKSFFVVKRTWCPAVLVEMFFHTSKSDCAICNTQKGKYNIIEALWKSFVEVHNKN